MLAKPRELAQVLRPETDLFEVVATETYPIAGVYGFGRGAFRREPITGSDTRYAKLNRLHRGQLVVSRLKAFEGAVAVVPDELDGLFVSQEFPTFTCVDGQLDPDYLKHVCRWPAFWSMLAASSKGIGSRRERIHARDLLRLELRIPSMNEQRRIAANLELVAAASERAGRLSKRAADLTDALTASFAARPDLDNHAKVAAGWRLVSLRQVAQQSTSVTNVFAAERYRIAGVYSFGKGLIDRGGISGTQTSYKKFTPLSVGDIVISKLGGWEGAVTTVGKEFEGFVVSPEFPTFVVDRSVLLPEYFGGLTRWPDLWQQIADRTQGSMARRKRITPTEFLDVEIWLPPISVQHETVAAIARVEATKWARERSERRIASLVPAVMNAAFAGLS